MDHFESVVLDFLRADRRLFINAQCCIQLNPGTNPDTSGPHWYCDAVAVSVRDRSAFLCEISYAVRLPALVARLKSWDQHWIALKEALARDCGIPVDWTLQPWLFVPNDRVDRLRLGARALSLMPEPRITALEEVLPWRYRSWDRGDCLDSGRD
ncbi:hypothetical protein QEG52_001356 [Stenotrophomonas maltophilia]|uniref:hypothetical protein n=1 Tax=Stenotrophomonas TaxID=40323 RepID=UPI0018D3B94C|nr:MULTISPECIES: hypothetical protein [Stenotrophomonas]EKV1265439.1 hypothetical protein [Stenotrophomonas maltophilia]MBH1729284.1 hypothetical protein [Stenotrophomonas maltophilia]MDQ7305485.1 hypothetical protein [Stenotrophomonas sp. Sm3119]